MSENSKIEWTDHTFNPWMGCTKVGPGCDQCYAETLMDTRYGKVHWGVGQPRVRTAPANWRKPAQWNGQPWVECTACRWRGNAADAWPPASGEARLCLHCRAPVQPTRARVFCASLADVFDNEVDPEWRRDLLRLIASTQNLDWLLLTKRIGNAGKMLAHAAASFGMTWGDHWRNVWLGATVVNQEEADRDIPKLLATPARVRFLSIEPMLGPIDLNSDSGLHGGPGQLDWIIAGGESGPGARPAHPDWFRSLRDRCADAGVPFLFKQWGEWGVFDGADDERRHGLSRIGKKAAGRLLDGVQHDGFPA